VVFCLFVFGSHVPKQELLLAGFYNQPENQKMFLEQKDLMTPEIPQIVISQNSFKQSTPTSLIKTETWASYGSEPEKRKEIIEYGVEKGDTLSSIAQKFDLSLETLLWTNDLSSKSKILPGEKLTILPTSGLTHLVTKGESLSYLAELYGAEAEEIAEFNELSEEKIFIGDLLVIPGGKMPSRRITVYTPLASSYFICPISSPCSISQGLHWYNAIDFSHGKCGEPVFASAGGQVQKTGYHPVAGNYVRILHPNGIVTFYGHLSKTSSWAGQSVSQGQIIGYIGNTGYTVGPSGCHVHFEVRGASNPFGR